MITAKDALKNALESEYVKNWLEEVNREIIEASTDSEEPKYYITKSVKGGCARLIIYKLESIGYKAEWDSFAGIIQIEWA